ncbi:MAG: DUF4862 family protein [Deltaproteobacteria bacterium]|nr:DUF4862 family protein [Deltaproteobacteria bacterium]
MNKAKRFIVGAYVSSISLRGWNEKDETLFFQSLRERPSIGGLEHAFYGTLHRYDDDWFLKNIDPTWDFVFTCLPGTTETLKTEPAIGLASNDPVAQGVSLEFISAANKAVKKLNAHLGRKAVLAVQVHSAPAVNASKEAFAKALTTICGWDWDGAKVLVEHCDAFRKDGTHAKGFLTLEEEIWAIQQIRKENLKTPLGAMLNWGRSVVEGRDPSHVLQHIETLQKEKLLNGFIFSGTTSAYADKHTPAPTPLKGELLAQDSLMTEEQIEKTLQMLKFNPLDYIGFKIMPHPIPLDCRDSLPYIDRMIQLLLSLRA